LPTAIGAVQIRDDVSTELIRRAMTELGA
jgi:hypothetical protein